MSVHNATRARWRRGRSIGPVLVVSGSIADAARTMDSASGELRRTDGRTERQYPRPASADNACVRPVIGCHHATSSRRASNIIDFVRPSRELTGCSTSSGRQPGGVLGP